MLGLSTTQIVLAAAVILLPILPNLWSIWHIFQHDFRSSQEKLAWLAAAVFLPVAGGVAYIIMGRKHARKPS
jgi:hypothetical protein